MRILVGGGAYRLGLANTARRTLYDIIKDDGPLSLTEIYEKCIEEVE